MVGQEGCQGNKEYHAGVNQQAFHRLVQGWAAHWGLIKGSADSPALGGRWLTGAQWLGGVMDLMRTEPWPVPCALWACLHRPSAVRKPFRVH